MFPLQARRQPKSTPYITYSLIGLNILVFIWELSLSQPELFSVFATQTYNPCTAGVSPDTFWDLTRTMFLHGGWTHIIGNMAFLAIFGPLVEDYLGKWRFLAFYMAVGYAASLFHGLLTTICGPTIGASGAIFGVMGAFLLLYPATRVRSVVLFLRVPIGTRDIQAFYLLFAFFFIDLINGIAAIGPFTVNTGNVAIWAHVGGFLAGLVMTFFIMIVKPAPEVDMLENIGND